MKILRIIARLNIGGPAIHTILLTEGLNKTRFQSLLVCGKVDKNEGDMDYYAREKNIKPKIIPELKRELNLFYDFIALNKIYQIIKVEKPDIIHTHTAKAGALGRLGGILYNFLHPFRDKRIKLVHSFHGHAFNGYFGRFKTSVFILIERFLALFSAKIITVSESVRDELVSLGICKEEKIAVIPLGFELDKLLNIPARDSDAFRIGIIGRLVPVKNHRLFLEAATQVIRNNPQVSLRFKIIGDGELRTELEEYACQLKINQYIDFLGWQNDLVSIYRDLDIVALTSVNEGTPLSLIEAMASARAVVATGVGGVKDLLGTEKERGIIVSPGDSFKFARALSILLQDSGLRKEMGRRARDFVRERFTKERLIKDMEGLYERTLA